MPSSLRPTREQPKISVAKVTREELIFSTALLLMASNLNGSCVYSADYTCSSALSLQPPFRTILIPELLEAMLKYNRAAIL
jgi:hypothetical protein